VRSKKWKASHRENLGNDGKKQIKKKYEHWLHTSFKNLFIISE